VISDLQKGYLRDKEILALVNRCKILNTEQIKLLLFHDVSERMARKRLQRLVEKEFLQRDRLSIAEPYFYWPVGCKRPGQIDHSLAVNWVYTWLNLKLSKWERLHSFERELDYKILRADGLAAINNTVSKQFDFHFVEMDRAESGNNFDKVSKYTTLYLSESYTNTWWAKLAHRFPGIVIVTTGKKERIEERIKLGNSEGLRFKVHTLKEIKEECFNG
jgi:hypothetical protein